MGKVVFDETFIEFRGIMMGSMLYSFRMALIYCG